MNNQLSLTKNKVKIMSKPINTNEETKVSIMNKSINTKKENQVNIMNKVTINSIKTKNILCKLDKQEMHTCLNAAMENLSNFSHENFYMTIQTDFEVLGNIMSGSDEHYKLMRKIKSFSTSEKIHLANICLGMLKGDIEEMEAITEAVDTHCIEKDIMTLTGFSNEYSETNFRNKENIYFTEKVKLLADVTYYEKIPEFLHEYDPDYINFEIYRTKKGAILCSQVVTIPQYDYRFIDSKICTDDHEINKFFKQNDSLSSIQSNLRKELYILAGISITNIAA